MRDLEDPVGDGIQETPVVRDDERRLRRRLLSLDEPRFEELEARHVEVVRRLVEEEDRGVAEEESRHLGPVLLSPRELPDGPAPRLAREADAEEDALDARVGLVPAVALEALANRVVLGEERLDRFGGLRTTRRRRSPPRGGASPPRARAAPPAHGRRSRGAARPPPARRPARARRTSSRRREGRVPRRARSGPGPPGGASTSPPRCGPRDLQRAPGRAARWRPRGRSSFRSSSGRARADRARAEDTLARGRPEREDLARIRGVQGAASRVTHTDVKDVRGFAGAWGVRGAANSAPRRARPPGGPQRPFARSVPSVPSLPASTRLRPAALAL